MAENEVIIEEQSDDIGLPPKLVPRIVIDDVFEDSNVLSITGRPNRPTARHPTDVSQKKISRIPDRTYSVPNRLTDLEGVKSTRSSLSRHSSRVREGRKDLEKPIEEQGSSDFLASITHDPEKSKVLKEKIKQSRTILENLKTKLKALKLELKTAAFSKSLELLKDKGLVHITGKIGSGKTHTSLQVMSAFLEEFEDYDPLIIQSPTELHILEDTSTCIVVLADDFLPSNNGDVSVALNGWEHSLKFINQLFDRRRLFLVFTSETTLSKDETDRFRQSTFVTLLKSCECICLDSVEYGLSEKERLKLLNAYCKRYCQSLSTSQREGQMYAKSENLVLGFPLLCNLVGIGQPSTLFTDVVGALREFVSTIREHQVICYVLTVLTVVLGKFSLASLQNEHVSVYRKVLASVGDIQCSHSELAVNLTKLKRQNVLSEDETGEVRFTNDIFVSAVVSEISTPFLEEMLPLMSVVELNKVARYVVFSEKGSGEPKSFTSHSIELSPNVLNILVTMVNDFLENKQPDTFLAVATLHLFSSSSFIDALVARLGCQIFFIEDKTSTPLSAYLVRVGHAALLKQIVNIMLLKQPRQIVTLMSTPVQKTIHEACRCCEQETVAQLLKVVSSYDDSVLFSAIQGGSLMLLDFLWNREPENTFTVSREMLETACRHGSFRILEYLYSKMEGQISSTFKKIEAKRPNRQGDSLIHFAAQGGCDEIFEFLLVNGHNPMAETRGGNTVLHIAAMFGRYRLVRHMCSLYPDYIFQRNNLSFTSAGLAAREGHCDILKLLVSRSSNVHETVKDENTLFHIAASNGHREILNYLWGIAAEQVDKANGKSFLPVQLAVMNGMTDTLRFFISKGTDPMTRTVDRRTFLHLAAFNGQYETVKYLTERYPKLLNERDVEGNTVAHDAAASGSVPVLKYLLEKDEDLSCTNNFGTNILHDAAFNGKLETVEYVSANFPFLLKGLNENGYTVCFGAAMSGNVKVMKYLVEKGVDPRAVSNEGSTCLHEAAYNNQLEMVQYLSKMYPEMVPVRNERSYMACHFAAQEGHLDTLMTLIADEKPPFPVTYEKQNLLHIAAYNGQMIIVEYLCEHYPDMLQAQDADESLAVHYAARGDHIEILKFLIDQGLSPEAITKTGSTILHLAAYDGNTTTVEYLCNEYPQLVRMLDATGHSAAHYAAGSGDMTSLEQILKQGADALLRAGNGSTLLHKAAYRGKMEMIKFLCSEYMDMVDTEDEFGCNFIHYAACAGSFESIQYGVDLGLDYKSKTNEGFTILHVAVFHNQAELVREICRNFPDLMDAKDGNGKTPVDTALESGLGNVLAVFQNLKRLPQESLSPNIIDDILCCHGTENRGSRVWQVLTAVVCFCRK